MRCCFTLDKGETLVGVRKERYTKPRAGRSAAFLVQDRLGKWTLVAQKLPLLADAINQHVAGDHSARVSTNGLWESVDRVGVRTGPWLKGRWLVKSVPLESVNHAFEQARRAHERCVVVADDFDCWSVAETA